MIWKNKMRSLVVVEPIQDLHELADKFRSKAFMLRAEVRGGLNFLPWSRDRKLIEAAVWEEAAVLVQNTVLVGDDYES